jgi:hypothetical protein
VTVQGTASDAQSGLSGGAAGVKLAGGTFNQPGTITGGNYSIAADLSTQTFGATEAAFPITVTLSDAAGNTAQQSGSLNVDNKPPVISGITISTADCLAAICGHDFYKAGAGNVTVTATIVDNGAGVAASTVFLQPAATGANTTFAAVPGQPGASNSYSFPLPRSVGNGLDGSSAVQFVIVANDALAASVTASDKVNHQAASVAQSIYFDDKPPTIVPAVDTKWYVRKVLGVNVIMVHATITDVGSGLSGTTLTVLDANNGNTPHTGAGICDATTHDCTFSLDSSYLLVNTEAGLSYTVTAQDNLSTGPTDAQHAKTVTDSRNVDGKPPTVAITRIYNASQPTAATAQVSYPDTVANTGYDAAGHFIYSDTVTVTGTIQDSGSGIAVSNSPATPNFEVDGTSPGPKFAITSCTDGATTVCNFTATVKLNAPTQAGAFAQSDATMQVVVNSADKALNADGTANGNVGSSSPVTFKVTRFWWKNLVSAAAVSGLAVYPSGGVTGVGEVIATVAAGAGDSVFSLYRTGPLHSGGSVAWQKGATFYTASVLGSVQGAPAIGAAATSPNIYVATAAGDVVAFNSAGGTTWSCAASGGTTALIDPVRNTPAIVQASKVGSQSNCEAVIAGADNTNIWAVCGTAPSACTSRSAPIAANGSSPVTALAGNYYVGAGNAISQASLNGTGGLIAGTPFTTTDTNAFNSVVTDGSEFYAFNNNAQKVYAFDASRTQRYSKVLTSAVNGSPLLLPSSATTPGLLFNENNKNVYVLGLTTSTPPETAVATLGIASALTTAPILGSDNRIYTDGGGLIYALNQKSPPFTTDWSYSIGAAANGPLTMDCQGVLYAASGGTVYAFITDAKGLGNSPWPKYQRDSRNSGNADATTLWGVNVSGTCTQ